MIVPINVSLPGPSSSRSGRTFPPQLAQFGNKELVLIELQGSLEVEGDREGQTVGTLRIDEATKKSTLLIGHHLLEGRLANLPKPIAVLHRSSTTPDDAPRDADTSVDGPASAQPMSWDVMTVVKRKMVFSRRPMPMVGKVAASAPQSKGGQK